MTKLPDLTVIPNSLLTKKSLAYLRQLASTRPSALTGLRWSFARLFCSFAGFRLAGRLLLAPFAGLPLFGCWGIPTLLSPAGMLGPLLGHIVGLREKAILEQRYNRTWVKSSVPGYGSSGSEINWPRGSGSVRNIWIFTNLSKTERNFYLKVTTYLFDYEHIISNGQN